MTKSDTHGSPLVVVTNDDGVEAPGLQCLAAALRERFEVLVVAPDGERSAIGHAVTMSAKWKVQQLDEDVFAVSGTPADCVYLALGQIASRPPAVVLSGVNNGYNLGTDVIYSGTVAAAAEATIIGYPGVAVSAEVGASHDTFVRAATFASRLAGWVVETGWAPPETLLSVNVPEGAGQRFRVGAMGIRKYKRPARRSQGPRSGEVFDMGRPRSLRDEGASGEDAEIIQSGDICVTPLRLDLTARDQLKVCRGITVDGFESGGSDLDATLDLESGAGGSGAHHR